VNQKIVLITGGARGIGAACVRAFANAGARVAVCDIDIDLAEQLCAEVRQGGGQAHAFTLDVRRRSQWLATIEKITAAWGTVDVLIGNAGIMPVGPFLEVSVEADVRQVDINLHGVTLGVRAVLPAMLDQGHGHIVNIASLAGRVPTPFGAVYSATKFAVVGFTEALGHELLGTNIHTTVVMPGFVQTELISGLDQPAWPSPSSPEQVAQTVLRAVIKRKRRVYLPWFGGLLALLPWVLPHWISVGLSKLFAIDHLLIPTDTDARDAYRQRAIEE
jgi:NADP-dependent 3-hydroxy acid dehydrogenase YdfG